MIAAMCREISERHGYLRDRQTGSVYFGGGTPSLLSPAELDQLLSSVRRFFTILPGAEITLEVNPDDVSGPMLEAWKSSGINRLSIGLQSFNDDELSWMNRAHTSAQSLQAVKLAQSAGFGNISIDLIYGSRFQTEASWAETLETAIGLGVQHISAYNLTVEEKTALGHHVRQGKEPGVDDSLSSRQFLHMIRRLNQAGFEQYEISNFSLPGYRAVHNSSYWLQQPYLGIGPAAHSFNGHSRQWNVKNNPAYIRAIENGQDYFEVEQLSRADMFNEYVLTRMRTSWGCNISEIEARFGPEFRQHFLEMASKYGDSFESVQGNYVLRELARLQADGIASDFFVLKES